MFCGSTFGNLRFDRIGVHPSVNRLAPVGRKDYISHMQTSGWLLRFRGRQPFAIRRDFHRASLRLAAGLLLAWTFVGNALAAEFPQGLIFHLTFDEAPVGGVVQDRSGRGNNGLATGTVWTAAGRRGGACEIAAINSYIRVPHSPSLNLTQTTFAVWFKTSQSSPLRRTLFDRDAALGFAMGITGKNPVALDRDRVFATVKGHSCQSDSAVTDGAWHHAAATFDGWKLKLYVDGRLQNQVVKGFGEIPANTNDVIVGMNGSCPTPAEQGTAFGGTIDEAMCFNHALTDAEVVAVFTYGKSALSKEQIARRLAELKELHDRGLLLQEFYDRKVKEYEAGQ